MSAVTCRIGLCIKAVLLSPADRPDSASLLIGPEPELRLHDRKSDIDTEQHDNGHQHSECRPHKVHKYIPELFTFFK